MLNPGIEKAARIPGLQYLVLDLEYFWLFLPAVTSDVQLNCDGLLTK